MVLRSPVYYDLKRGLLRLSVVVLLALFTVLGIGLAYMTVAQLASTANPASYALIFVVDPGRKIAYVEGYVFMPAREGLVDAPGSLNYEVRCGRLGTDITSWSVVASDKVNFRGRFRSEVRLSDEIAKYLERGEYNCYVNYGVYTPPYGRGSMTNLIKDAAMGGRVVYHYLLTSGSMLIVPVPIPVESTNFTALAYAMIGVQAVRVERGVIFVVATSNPVGIDGGFELYARTANLTEISKATIPAITTTVEGSEPEDFVRVGLFRHGISILEAEIDGDILEIAVVYRDTVTSSPHFTNVPAFNVETSFRGIVVSAMFVPVATFTALFPVVVLYLVYVYVAKPRSQGALEFIVARPITRQDLYLTRFTAGILVLAVAVSIFYLSTVVSISVLLGVVFDTYTAILLYAGILVPLVAFYSLCYFLSALTSGTRYLVASIVVYLLFGLLINVVVYFVVVAMHGGVWHGPEFYRDLERANYIAAHLNPLGFGNFARFYIQELHGLIGIETIRNVGDIASPVFVALSTILWITVPFTVGWIVFRRANLSR